MGVNHYEILGIDRTASPEEIRQAYFRLAREYHPDSNATESAREIFLRTQEAYEVLNNPRKRKQYDLLTQDLQPVKLSVKTNLVLSSKQIPFLQEPQLFYALLEIKPQDELTDQIQNQVHICFVIDRSTSMNGNRIDMIRRYILKTITKLNPRDLISIVVFNDNAEIILSPTSVSSLGTIEKRLSSISTSGGTEIYKGLKAGIELLWQGKSKNLLRHLFLFTDGHTYGDEIPSLELASEAAEQGIMISAFGIGHEWNDRFIDELANHTGGRSIFVNNPEDLYDYLARFLNFNKNIYARKSSISFTSDPRVKLQYIFKVTPDIAELSILSPVIIGDLYRDQPSTILFALQIESADRANNEMKLLNGLIQMVLNSSNEENAEEALKIVVKTGEFQKQASPPVEILRALSKITFFQMQEKARQDVMQGESKQAVRRLGFMATRLIAQGNQPLADILLDEAEKIRNGNAFSDYGDKRIKYGTRALLQLPEPNKR